MLDYKAAAFRYFTNSLEIQPGGDLNVRLQEAIANVDQQSVQREAQIVTPSDNPIFDVRLSGQYQESSFQIQGVSLADEGATIPVFAQAHEINLIDLKNGQKIATTRLKDEIGQYIFALSNQGRFGHTLVLETEKDGRFLRSLAIIEKQSGTYFTDIGEVEDFVFNLLLQLINLKLESDRSIEGVSFPDLHQLAARIGANDLHRLIALLKRLKRGDLEETLRLMKGAIVQTANDANKLSESNQVLRSSITAVVVKEMGQAVEKEDASGDLGSVLDSFRQTLEKTVRELDAATLINKARNLERNVIEVEKLTLKIQPTPTPIPAPTASLVAQPIAPISTPIPSPTPAPVPTATPLPGAPNITSFTPTSAPASATITFTGFNFSSVSAVRFNGVPTTFSRISDSTLTAIVPSGAKTGSVSIGNVAGTTATSSFKVIQIPAIPTGLLSSNVADTSFTLGWNAVAEADSYKVYKDGVLYASNVTTPSKAIVGLSASTNYNMQVSAINAAGESGKSSLLSVATRNNDMFDFNGDGFADTIVGAKTNDDGGSDAGAVYIFFGAASPTNVNLSTGGSANVTFVGKTANDGFGGNVSSAGDVNGDGFSDTIIGAGNNSVGGSGAGAAYIFFGSASLTNVNLSTGGSANVTFIGKAAGDQFGSSVSGH